MVAIATATARLRELDAALAADPTNAGLLAQRAAALDDLATASARAIATEATSPRKRPRTRK
jgi:hypothetical protein